MPLPRRRILDGQQRIDAPGRSATERRPRAERLSEAALVQAPVVAAQLTRISFRELERRYEVKRAAQLKAEAEHAAKRARGELPPIPPEEAAKRLE